MIIHKMIEDEPGDRETYGFDTIEIHGHLFEFQAHCDLRIPEIKNLIKDDPLTTKYKINYRNGNTGRWTKNFIK